MRSSMFPRLFTMAFACPSWMDVRVRAEDVTVIPNGDTVTTETADAVCESMGHRIKFRWPHTFHAYFKKCSI